MKNWQRVFADQRLYRAEIVKGVLMECGLQPVLLNKQDAVYLMGLFEIHVPTDEVIRAIKIITDDIRFE